MEYRIAFIAGILLAIAGILKLAYTYVQLGASRVALATVIRIEEIDDGDGSTWRPIFSYRTIGGEEIVYSDHPSSGQGNWKVGQKQEVAYRADAPWSPVVLTYFGTFGWTIGLLAASAPLLLVGGGYFLFQKFFERFITTHS